MKLPTNYDVFPYGVIDLEEVLSPYESRHLFYLVATAILSLESLSEQPNEPFRGLLRDVLTRFETLYGPFHSSHKDT